MKLFAQMSTNFLPLSTFIALRYLKSKRFKALPSLISCIAFFGILISVFTLISVISVMEGFKAEFAKNVIGLRPHAKIYFLNQGGSLARLNISEAKTLEFQVKIPEIARLNPAISGEAMISDVNGAKLSGIMVTGFEAEDFLSRPILKNSILVGNLEGFNEKEGIVLGAELARSLGVSVGDSVNLISPVIRKTPFGSIPAHKTMQVLAVFSVGMYFYDSNFAFLPLKMARTFFDYGTNEASFLEVLMEDPQNLGEIRQKIGAFYSPRRVYISDWKTENKSFMEAISLQKNVMFFILLMFVIVASFIVFAGLTMMVGEKAKSIAIFKTIGAGNGLIMRIFLQVGLFISVPACILGAALGALFTLKLEAIKNWLEQLSGAKIFDGAHYFLSYIPTVLDFWTIFFVTSLSFGLCFIAILIPSIKTLKSKPINALRWE